MREKMGGGGREREREIKKDGEVQTKRVDRVSPPGSRPLPLSDSSQTPVVPKNPLSAEQDPSVNRL